MSETSSVAVGALLLNYDDDVGNKATEKLASIKPTRMAVFLIDSLIVIIVLSSSKQADCLRNYSMS